MSWCTITIVTPARVTIMRSTPISSRTLAGPSSVFADRRRAASNTQQLHLKASEVGDDLLDPARIIEVDAAPD